MIERVDSASTIQLDYESPNRHDNSSPLLKTGRIKLGFLDQGIKISLNKTAEKKIDKVRKEFAPRARFAKSDRKINSTGGSNVSTIHSMN